MGTGVGEIAYMKLLIVTQAVDTEDPVLGFFVRWIAELAKRVEHVEVICLKEGGHHLPSNVRVHSLGKEHSRQSRFVYAWRFETLIWSLRREYGTVFVHMNPEYMLLGGLFWQLWGKRVSFWYNHPQDDVRLRLALPLANRVFYTSPYAASVRSKKAMQMSVGIDTALFRPEALPRKPLSIYLQGRIMPSKRVHILLEALRLLRAQGVAATLTIVGPEDPDYGEKLRTDFGGLVRAGVLIFLGPKKNEETPALYASHRVSVNLAAAGHFDKAAFEAMACETPVIVSSKAFGGLVPDEWIVPEEDHVALAGALKRLLELSNETYAALGGAERQSVVKNHSLDRLAEELVKAL
jgi:glycosyltransferase involved in cell wall biosynthesis